MEPNVGGRSFIREWDRMKSGWALISGYTYIFIPDTLIYLRTYTIGILMYMALDWTIRTSSPHFLE